MKKLIFCHLLNDASGSPHVLLQVIKALGSDKQNAKLFIGSAGNGVLDKCGIEISRYRYYRSRHRIATLVSYLASQIHLFFALLNDRSIDRDAVIYVNTLLPFGAAIFGKLTGRKVIYHVHEISVEPKLLKYFLCGVVRLTSSRNIYVSRAHAVALPIGDVSAMQIYNSLDEEFIEVASQSIYHARHKNVFKILMIASLRDYKGIPELLTLASILEYRRDIHFVLVVNDDQATIDRYFLRKACPGNLIVHPRTDNPAIFYKDASLVLNLSRVDVCVETFGLTILEAMAFGVPVIVPPVGGPAELVSDSVEGFLVDSRNSEVLKEKVLALADNYELCNAMSDAARRRAQCFSTQTFTASVRAVFELDFQN